jgi:hypothetical protein
MKVKARDELIAKAIKHPSGIKFSADGTAHWPDDSFTRRRIRDGDITVVEEDQPRRPIGQVRREQRQHRSSERSEKSED